MTIACTRKAGGRVMLAGDKLIDAESIVMDLKVRAVIPHIAIDGRVFNSGRVRKTSVDGRTTRHLGNAMSLHCRNRIEEAFGWVKNIGGAARLKVRGLARTINTFLTSGMIAHKLIRILELIVVAV